METPIYYFPPKPSEYPGWLENFYTVLDGYKVLLAIATGDMTYLNTARLGLNYYAKCVTSYDEFSSKCVGTRNIYIYGNPENPGQGPLGFPVVPAGPTVPVDQVSPNIHEWIVTFVGRLRKNPEMTPVISKALGIDSRPNPNYNGEPPVLKGKVVSGQAQLNCPLKNYKGYEVWRQDTPGGTFVKVGTSLSRFYTDASELPEGINAAQHTYVIRMVANDNVPVGLVSNEVSLAVFRSPVPI